MPLSTEPKDAGFGLIEMLVVLTILGVILSFAFPFLGADREANPDHMAQQIALLAQNARLTAIKENREVHLNLSMRDRTIRDDHLGRVLQIPEALSFEVTYGQRQDAVTTDADITFFSSGGSTGGSIRVSRGAEHFAIVTINWLTGSVSVSQEKPTAQ